MAVINQPTLEAADHEKGWTVYRDLWIKHGFSEGGGWKLNEIYLRDKNGKHTDQGWSTGSFLIHRLAPLSLFFLPTRKQLTGVGVNGVDDGGQGVLVRADGSIVADPSQAGKADQLRPLHPSFYNLNNSYPGDWVLWPRYIDQLESAAR